jgi:5-methylcytosine-specific restriction endonuclease McrA
VTDAHHGYPDALRDIVQALIRRDRRAADERIATIAHEPQPVTVRRTPTVRKLAAIYERDRYQCRYCGARTVLTPVMRLLAVAYPREFPYHKNWKAGEVHPAIEIISATHDHVNPVTRGGDSLDDGNIVTACWVCNSAKGNLPLDALGWTLRDPADGTWHGLADVYAPLWEALGRPELGPNERAWLAMTRDLYRAGG